MYSKVGFLSNKIVVVGTDIDLYLGKNEMNQEIHSKLLTYLNHGVVVFSFMEISEDIEGNQIGPYEICTDGIWIWPSYFSYFLKKYPNYKIDKPFLDYVKLHDFKIRKLKQEEIQKIENYFISNP